MQDVSSKHLAVGFIVGVCLFVYGAANWHQHELRTPPKPPEPSGIGSSEVFQQRVAAYEIATKQFQERNLDANKPSIDLSIDLPGSLAITWGGVALAVVCVVVAIHRNVE